MDISKFQSLDVICLDECEGLILDISRTIRKPISCLTRPNSLVAIMDDTVLNVWPGPEVNMRFPWDNEHAVDSIEFTCSKPGANFLRGHISLKNNLSYMQLREEIMKALLQDKSSVN